MGVYVRIVQEYLDNPKCSKADCDAKIESFNASQQDLETGSNEATHKLNDARMRGRKPERGLFEKALRLVGKKLKFKVPWRVRSIDIKGLLPQGDRAERLELNLLDPMELALDSLLAALDSAIPLLLEVRTLLF
jgi:hypothetical protein